MINEFTSGVVVGFAIGVVTCCAVLLVCLGIGGRFFKKEGV